MVPKDTQYFIHGALSARKIARKWCLANWNNSRGDLRKCDEIEPWNACAKLKTSIIARDVHPDIAGVRGAKVSDATLVGRDLKSLISEMLNVVTRAGNLL